jgi:hypothetical protein
MQSPKSHLRQYIVVHFFTVFPVWRLLLPALTRHGRWEFPSSLACVARLLYTERSIPTAALLVGTCTSISVPVLMSNPSATFSWRDVHWPLPCRIDERKFASAILYSFFQMNNRAASGLISPHQLYTCCSPTQQLVSFYDVSPLTMAPQQIYLRGQWLGKRHHGCPPTWWLFANLLLCLSVCFILYKVEHFCAEECFKHIPGRTVLSYMEIFIYP